MSKQNSSILTNKGFLVDPFDLKPEDCDKIDFPKALSFINRFTGHTFYPYSVGQHTLVLHGYVPERLQRAALIHDYSEALFNDLASPIKREFPNYIRAEEAAQRVIFERYGVPWGAMEELDQYDKAVFVNERKALFIEPIDKGGMGSKRKGLQVEPQCFDYMDWEDVKSHLQYLHDLYF